MSVKITDKIITAFHRAAYRVNKLNTELKNHRLSPLERRSKLALLEQYKKHAAAIDAFDTDLKTEKLKKKQSNNQ